MVRKSSKYTETMPASDRNGCAQSAKYPFPSSICCAELNEPEQYQLFDTPQYSYRVFVTNLDAPIDVVVGFYRQRAGGGESDQRSQQRCGLGGASIGAMGHELCALPVGDAGLQPELLADAV